MYKTRQSLGLLDCKYTGKNVGIAYLDTGVASHPDFIHRVIAFKDFVNKRREPYDDNGHGTHVTGCGSGNGYLSNGKYKGIASKSNIVVCKVLESNGDGFIETFIQAIDWIDHNSKELNIRVVNASFEINNHGITIRNKDLDEAIARLADKNIMLVVACGNKKIKQNPMFISNERNVILTGMNTSKRKLGFNSCDIDIPGNKIVSCNQEYLMEPYTTKSGTSMSAGIMSGIIALLFEKQSFAPCEQIREKVLNCKGFWNVSNLLV